MVKAADETGCDLLYIKSIDRLGRAQFHEEILEQWQILTKEGIDIVVLDMPLLDTREEEKDLIGDIFKVILSFRYCHLCSGERTDKHPAAPGQKERLPAAKPKGVKFGAQPLALSGKFQEDHPIVTGEKRR